MLVNKNLFLAAGVVAFASTAILFSTEAYFSYGFPFGVPWAVFGFLAVASFSAVAATTVGVAKFSSNKLAGTGLVIVGVVALSAWVTLFVDQLPCFLGGSGC